jgi:acyl carrier protein
VQARDVTLSDQDGAAEATDRGGARERLVRCFRAVFGSLTLEEISRASADSVEGWDSVATVTLAAVVEEEFGFQLDPSELEELTSFERILKIVERRLRA